MYAAKLGAISQLQRAAASSLKRWWSGGVSRRASPARTSGSGVCSWNARIAIVVVAMLIALPANLQAQDMPPDPPPRPENSEAIGLEITPADVAKVDVTITAVTDNIADGNMIPDPPNYMFVWHRLPGTAGTPDQVGTASAYTPVKADEGSTLRLTVTFTDVDMYPETLTVETGTVERRDNFEPSGAPLVLYDTASGPSATNVGAANPQVGSVLAVNDSGIMDGNQFRSPKGFTYQWQRTNDENPTEGEWGDIGGETSTTIELTNSDVAHRIRVWVSYTDNDAYNEVVASAFTNFVNGAATGQPSIVGTDSRGGAAVGVPLTAARGTIDDANGITSPTFSYVWQRRDDDPAAAWEDITGATSMMYTTEASDVDYAIRVRVSFMDDDGNSEETVSDATLPVNGAATGVPLHSMPTDPPPAVGVALTSARGNIEDPNGMVTASFSYQWQRRNDDIQDAAWTDIVGGTNFIYTPVATDIGHELRVLWSFDDDNGYSEQRASLPSQPVNGPATGMPSIKGEVAVGKVLEAVNDDPTTPVLDPTFDDPNGLTMAEFTYQWQRMDERVSGSPWTDITSATSNVYRPIDGDAGYVIRVMVRFTDDDGHMESVTSLATATINGIAMGAPSIDFLRSQGANDTPYARAPEVGETLLANTSDISDPNGVERNSFRYRWFREDSDGSNRVRIRDIELTVDRYTLAAEDTGKRISLEVRFTDNQGFVERPEASNPTLGVNSPVMGSATIEFLDRRSASDSPFARTPEVGETLSANTRRIADLNGLGEFEYRWFREDDDRSNRVRIAGASGETYTLVAADAGRKISLETPFVDQDGNREAPGASRETDLVNDVARGPLDGSVPIALRTHPRGSTPTYTLNGVPGNSYVVHFGTLEDDNGIPAAEDLTIEWARLDSGNIATVIQGETDDNYSLRPADAGSRIRATVRFTDGNGFAEEIRSEPSPIVNALASGQPTISGSSAVGEVLSANASSIEDNNGLNSANFRYVWIRVGDGRSLDIAGAVGSTYTIVEEDAGLRVRVRVEFFDDDGFFESRTSGRYPQSNGFSQGGRIDGEAMGRPGITGTAKVDSLLVADTVDIEDVNGLSRASFSYQWIRLNADGTEVADIAGETGRRYTVVKADEGKRIRVRVSFSDNQGDANELTSESTAVVVRRDNFDPVGSLTVVARLDCQSATSADVKVGSTLKADTSGISDGNGVSSYSYQWSRMNADGSNSMHVGTDSDCYMLVKADEGKVMRVVARYVDDDGYSEVFTSTETASVARRDDIPATGKPVIQFAESGRGASVMAPKVDEMLEVDLTDFDDDGNGGVIVSTLRYRWMRVEVGGGQVETGENSPFYTLIKADEGSRIQVEVRYVDADGYSDRVLSDASEVVGRRINHEATGMPTVRGSARVGTTLTADPSTIEDTNGFTSALTNSAFTWQWYRQDADGSGREIIPGASTDRYRVTLEDSEKELLVSVSFTDDDGYLEQPLFSDPDSARFRTLVKGFSTLRASGLTHLLAGMSRTLSVSVVNVVWDRIGSVASQRDEPSVYIGGRELDTGAFAANGNADAAAKEVFGLLGVKAVSPDDSPPVSSENTLSGSSLDDYLRWASLPDSRGLLDGTRMTLSLDNYGREKLGGVSAWLQGDMGAFDRQNIDGVFSESSTDGSLAAGHAGIEYISPLGSMIGFAVSHSVGDAEYSFVDPRQSNASVETLITSVTPYLYYRSVIGAGLWGAYSQGSGTLELQDEGGEVETDMSVQSAAVGLHGGTLPLGELDFRLKGDYFATSVIAEEVEQGAELLEVDTFSSRTRLVLEGTIERAYENGVNATGKFELGARMDEGDVDSGLGAEAAAEFRIGSSYGIELRGRGSTLFYHEQKGHQEWGASLGFIYDPGPYLRGVSLTLEPVWNSPVEGAADNVWNADSSYGLTDLSRSNGGAALRARIGYGVGVMNDSGLATLYSEVETDQEEERLRLGTELSELGTRAGDLTIGFYGEQSESGTGQNSAIMVKGSFGF